jgi:hypothetical protein
MRFIKLLHEGSESWEQGRSIRYGEHDELDVGPLRCCSDDVAQCRDELRLMSGEKLLVVDVEPNEDVLHSGLEMHSFEK